MRSFLYTDLTQLKKKSLIIRPQLLFTELKGFSYDYSLKFYLPAYSQG